MSLIFIILFKHLNAVTHEQHFYLGYMDLCSRHTFMIIWFVNLIHEIDGILIPKNETQIVYNSP